MPCLHWLAFYIPNAPENRLNNMGGVLLRNDGVGGSVTDSESGARGEKLPLSNPLLLVFFRMKNKVSNPILREWISRSIHDAFIFYFHAPFRGRGTL